MTTVSVQVVDYQLDFKKIIINLNTIQNENSKKNNEYNGTGCHNDFNSFL